MERLAELREKAIRDEKALYNTGIREGTEIGKKLGQKLGREEGERKKKIEVIKKMLQENLNKENYKCN